MHEERTTAFDFQQSAEASAPLQRQPCLVEVAGESTGRIFCLDTPQATLGRSAECTFQLESEGVSRTHGVFQQTHEGIQVEDLRSTNGVFVNGFQVHKQLLKDGDKISFGPNAVLVFRIYDLAETLALSQPYETLNRDHLTGAFHSQSYLEWLEAEILQAREKRFDVAALFLRFDQGEHLRRRIGQDLIDQQVLRLYDVLARTKPEQSPLARIAAHDWALGLTFTRRAEIAELCQRLQQEISGMEPVALVKGPFSASLGVVSTRDLAVPDPQRMLSKGAQKLAVASTHGAGSVVL